jgi:hypothetical protein
MNTEPLFASFVAMLIDTLTAMVPGAATDALTSEKRREIARLLFDAFQPRNAIEAMLATRAIAAHHACMDNFIRAAKPGMSDTSVMRLRGNALAAGRSFDAVLRGLRKPRAQEVVERAKPAVADRPRPAAQPAPRPTDPRIAAPPQAYAPLPPLRRADLHGSTSLASTRQPELAPVPA